MKYSVPIIHVILLSMTVIGLKNHVTILPPLLLHVGRDGWASVLLATLAILLWVFLLLYIHKKTNQKEIKQWLEEKLGKVWSTIFHIIVAFFFMLLAAFTMRETLQWINATFLIETPVFPLLIIYSVLCILLASTSLRTILITNAIVFYTDLQMSEFLSEHVYRKNNMTWKKFQKDGKIELTEDSIRTLDVDIRKFKAGRKSLSDTFK